MALPFGGTAQRWRQQRTRTQYGKAAVVTEASAWGAGGTETRKPAEVRVLTRRGRWQGAGPWRCRVRGLRAECVSGGGYACQGPEASVWPFGCVEGTESRPVHLVGASGKGDGDGSGTWPEALCARFTVGETGREAGFVEQWQEEAKNWLWDGLQWEGPRSRHRAEGRLE